MSDRIIYLDANATSRLRPCVSGVLEEFAGDAGLRNPSSVHSLGRKARARLQQARRSILQLANHGEARKDQRLFFTSGGTEACNAIVFGLLGPQWALGRHPAHVVTSAIEHPAILEAVSALEHGGWSVTRVLPEPDGRVNPADVAAAITPRTALVSIMTANNETGAIQPVAQCAQLLRARGFAGPITSDFTQAIGKTSVRAADLFAAGVNALAVSGHKLGAPAGVGAVLLATGESSSCFSFSPTLAGGPQENYDRPGTENLFGALAFGAVSREVLATLQHDLAARRLLREQLWSLLQATECVTRLTPMDAAENGNMELSVANTLLLMCEGCRGDDLVVALDLAGVAVSTGSACSSGKQGVSHVVTAMGYPPEKAREVVRFSLDWDTCSSDVERTAALFGDVLSKMRQRVQGDSAAELGEAAVR